MCYSSTRLTLLVDALYPPLLRVAYSTRRLCSFPVEKRNRFAMIMFGVLRRPHLLLLWTSQVLSTIGDSLYQIALILIAVNIAGSGAGLVGAAEAGTFFAFGLLGGVYADRWNRRWTMVGVDLLRALIVLLLALLALSPFLRLYHLVLVSVLVGSLGSFFDPALQASLPALAPEEQTLQATNALMDLTRRLARIIGPLLAGLLIGVVSLAHLFTLDSVSFVISALAIFALGSKFAWRAAGQRDRQRTNTGILKEIGGAWHLLWSHPTLRWALIVHGITSLLWRAAFIVGVALFATRMLSGTAGAYGWIVGAYGMGSVLASLGLGSIMIRRRSASMFTGKILLGAGFVLLVSTIRLPIALLGAGLAGLGAPVFDIMISTIIQTQLPGNQIGKVSSARFLVEDAGNFLGLLLAVPLFAVLSAPLGVGLCAVLMMAIGAFGLIGFGLREPALPVPSSRSQGDN
jgi:DHA3 family macrolide efflux protein-like MFS transporter